MKKIISIIILFALITAQAEPALVIRAEKMGTVPNALLESDWDCPHFFNTIRPVSARETRASKALASALGAPAKDGLTAQEAAERLLQWAELTLETERGTMDERRRTMDEIEHSELNPPVWHADCAMLGKRLNPDDPNSPIVTLTPEVADVLPVIFHEHSRSQDPDEPYRVLGLIYFTALVRGAEISEDTTRLLLEPNFAVLCRQPKYRAEFNDKYQHITVLIRSQMEQGGCSSFLDELEKTNMFALDMCYELLLYRTQHPATARQRDYFEHAVKTLEGFLNESDSKAKKAKSKWNQIQGFAYTIYGNVTAAVSCLRRAIEVYGSETTMAEVGRALAELALSAEGQREITIDGQPATVALACRRVAEGLGGEALAVFEEEILRFEKRFLAVAMLQHEIINFVGRSYAALDDLKNDVPANYVIWIEENLPLREEKQLDAEYKALPAKQGGKLGRMQACEWNEKIVGLHKRFSEETIAFLDKISAYKQSASYQTAKQGASFILSLLDAFDEKKGIVLEDKKPVNPKIVLEMIDEHYRHKAELDGHSFTISISEDCQQILSSELAIWIIMSNLIRNAIHAMNKAKNMSKRGKNLSLSIEVKPNLSDLYTVVMTVKDEGIGIQNEIKDRIFEPFFTTSLPYSLIVLHGLGLAIVKEIVQSHGGSIDVESRHISEYPDDHGTTFTIKLPAAVAALTGPESFASLRSGAGLPVALGEPEPDKAQATLASEI